MNFNNFNYHKCLTVFYYNVPVSNTCLLYWYSLMYVYVSLQILQKYFPGGFFGEDRDGHPVYYDFYGNIDVRGKLIERI